MRWIIMNKIKIGAVGDIHASQYSSIIRRRGSKYSARLENIINSINWSEEQLKDCDMIIYLGDFWDQPQLNAEEISALREIKWNDSRHIMLAGNHEMASNNHSYSSSFLFNISNKFEVISTPTTMAIDDFNRLCFLPYILENDKKSLEEYFPKTQHNNTIIFSHNDIKGLQLGSWLSTDGFELDDINKNCAYYVNGHLHNEFVMKLENSTILNVGNLTGQTFGEDAYRYKHQIYSITIEDGNVTYENYENPYAFNFYKIDATESNLIDIDWKLKSNAVVSVKCNEDQVEEIRNIIKNNSNIVDNRVIVCYNNKDNINKELIEEYSLSMNHLETFQKYIKELIGDTNIVNEELLEVCK